MDRSLYISMSGAKETLLNTAVNNQNLANATTNGFRAEFAQARSMPVFGPGHPVRAYAMTEKPAIDFQSGPLVTTDRSLDIAIKGDGWLSVQAKDGDTAFTRQGNLEVSPNGQLMTKTGHPVMGSSGPIFIPPAREISVANDGTITIIPEGAGSNETAIIDQIRLVNPAKETLYKGDDGLIRSTNTDEEPAAQVSLVSGMLESSNVNTVSSLVTLMELSRRFEMQIKMMESSSTLDQATNRIMRIG